MSQLRTNFLNWRPDQEPANHDGLTIAQNVVHDVDGYKAIYLHASGSFATTGALSSVTSIVSKPVGSGSNVLSAWFGGGQINIALDGVTITTAATGYPLSFATVGSNQVISAFDVCESNGYVFFTVEAQQNQSSPSTVTSISHVGLAVLS